MCILIHHPKDSCFRSEQLMDFYSKNSDGFGAIVKKGDTVEVIKSVGKYEEIEDLYYEQVACHEAVIHFRMKTHGEIDLANCHPYEVMPGLWMAHNGILHTGNSADPKMSDTWHYIQDYLRPMLEMKPELLQLEAFQKMIGNHIGGSNKFGFMDQDGNTVIINRTSGVEHEGIWYSNTYAWTPWKFGLGKPPGATIYTGGPSTNRSTGKSYNHSAFASSPTWRAWDKIEREEAQKELPFTPIKAKPKKQKSNGKSYAKKKATRKLSTSALARIIRSSYNAVALEDYDGIVRWVNERPMAAMHLIYELCGSESNPMYTKQAVSDKVNADPDWAAETIVDLWYDMEDILLDIAGIPKEMGGLHNVQQ